MPTHTLDNQLHNQLSSFTLNHRRNVVSQIKPINFKIVLFNKVTIFFRQKIVRLESQPSAFEPKKISCLKTFLSQFAAIFFRPAIFSSLAEKPTKPNRASHESNILSKMCIRVKRNQTSENNFFRVVIFLPGMFQRVPLI